MCQEVARDFGCTDGCSVASDEELNCSCDMAQLVCNHYKAVKETCYDKNCAIEPCYDKNCGGLMEPCYNADCGASVSDCSSCLTFQMSKKKGKRSKKTMAAKASRHRQNKGAKKGQVYMSSNGCHSFKDYGTLNNSEPGVVTPESAYSSTSDMIPDLANQCKEEQEYDIKMPKTAKNAERGLLLRRDFSFNPQMSDQKTTNQEIVCCT